MSDMVYRPSKWQNEFHSLPHHEALGAGAAGPGKSLALLMDPLAQIMIENERCTLSKSNPNFIGWGDSKGWALHLRRTFKMLDQTIATAQMIFPKIDPGVQWHKSEMTFRFTSGFRYQFGHCHRTEDWQQFLSSQFTHIGFDELVQFKEIQYTHIKARLRTSDPVLQKMMRVRAMSNPMCVMDTGEHFEIDDPHWVRNYFVAPHPEGRVTMKKPMRRSDGTIAMRTRIYLPARLTDNPDPEFVRTYEETLLDMPAHLRAAFLYGDWFVTIGSFYAEQWRRDLHVCNPFRIPPEWRRFRSMDWGFKKYGCIHWWAVDDDDTMFCEKELSFKGKSAVEVAHIIRDVERKMGLWSTSAGNSGHSLITGPADTQLWEERGSVAKTMGQQMADEGVPWVKANKRSRQANAQRLIDRLEDHGHGTQNPGIVFFATCKKATETIPSIPTDPTNSECPMDGGEDHWHDSVLYACSYQSFDRAYVVAPEEHKEDDIWDDDDDTKQPVNENRGRWGYGSAIC